MGESIPETIKSIKRALSGDLFMVLLIVFVGSASFGLGRLSSEQISHEPVRIEYGAALNTAATGGSTGNSTVRTSNAQNISAAAASAEGGFVGSRNGSKYHFPWCSGAQRIKPENLVHFATRVEAENAGYTPAANCKGL